LLEKKTFGSINHEDKKKWTGIMWAACKDYVEIVRLLISHDAHRMYVDDEAHEKRATLGVINPATK
jgi:ankyrin repeat protein